jgi:hypothetical protein
MGYAGVRVLYIWWSAGTTARERAGCNTSDFPAAKLHMSDNRAEINNVSTQKAISHVS